MKYLLIIHFQMLNHLIEHIKLVMLLDFYLMAIFSMSEDATCKEKLEDLEDLSEFFIITNVESLRNKDIKDKWSIYDDLLNKNGNNILGKEKLVNKYNDDSTIYQFLTTEEDQEKMRSCIEYLSSFIVDFDNDGDNKENEEKLQGVNMERPKGPKKSQNKNYAYD